MLGFASSGVAVCRGEWLQLRPRVPFRCAAWASCAVHGASLRSSAACGANVATCDAAGDPVSCDTDPADGTFAITGTFCTLTCADGFYTVDGTVDGATCAGSFCAWMLAPSAPMLSCSLATSDPQHVATMWPPALTGLAALLRATQPLVVFLCQMALTQPVPWNATMGFTA